MGLLYNVSIFLYGAILKLASLFVPKAKLWVEGRRDWRLKYAELLADIHNPVWLHAASLGEFEQGRPVLESIKNKYPNRPIVLTFFSPSGFEVRKNWEGADVVIYLPLDTKKNAQDFISLLNPSVAIFVKYEFWMNTLAVLRERGIPTLLISGIFRTNHVFFKSYGKWFRQQMKAFTMAFMQNQESVTLATKIQVPAQLSGDTRFDRVIEISEKATPVEKVREFANAHPTVVAGSSWPSEEKMLSEFVSNHSEVRVVIVPHEVGEGHLKQIERLFQGKCIRLSQFDHQPNDFQVLIVDQMGMLSRIYREATIAILGGGFGAGIHNTLEAAVYGIPVLFGPKYDKFIEAHELIACEGAVSSSTPEEMKTVLAALLADHSAISHRGEQAKKYVVQNAGATKQIVSYLADNVLN